MSLISFCFFAFVPFFLLCLLLLERCLVDLPHGLAVQFVVIFDAALIPLICSQFLQRPKRTYPAHTMAESDRSRSPVPGRNRADPGAPCPTSTTRAAVLSSMVWGPCKRQFGNRNVCQGLSLDLSSVLSSTCHSRDLILEIHP